MTVTKERYFVTWHLTHKNHGKRRLALYLPINHQGRNSIAPSIFSSYADNRPYGTIYHFAVPSWKVALKYLIPIQENNTFDQSSRRFQHLPYSQEHNRCLVATGCSQFQISSASVNHPKSSSRAKISLSQTTDATASSLAWLANAVTTPCGRGRLDYPAIVAATVSLHGPFSPRVVA
jgi:hypothetical protein